MKVGQSCREGGLEVSRVLISPQTLFRPPLSCFRLTTSRLCSHLPLRLCCRSSLYSVLDEMKVVAAYLLAVLGGKTSPSAADLKDILGSVGAEADGDRIELLLSEVKGKDITELIASGREKLASVPSGGGAVAYSAPAADAGAAAPAAAEQKKEEKVEEKEDTDDDMGFSLFD